MIDSFISLNTGGGAILSMNLFLYEQLDKTHSQNVCILKSCSVNSNSLNRVGEVCRPAQTASSFDQENYTVLKL